MEKAGSAIVFALLRGVVFLVPAFLGLSAVMGVRGIGLALAASEMLTSVCIIGYWLAHRSRHTFK